MSEIKIHRAIELAERLRSPSPHPAWGKDAANMLEIIPALAAERENIAAILGVPGAEGAAIADAALDLLAQLERERAARKQAQIDREQAIEDRNRAGVKARVELGHKPLLFVNCTAAYQEWMRSGISTDNSVQEHYNAFCAGWRMRADASGKA